MLFLLVLWIHIDQPSHSFIEGVSKLLAVEGSAITISIVVYLKLQSATVDSHLSNRMDGAIVHFWWRFV